MTRWVTWLWIAFLFSIPVWMTDQYFLHILITAGIFIIAAMSLNLLLGYTGQLSLGHVAFFGIGAYTSALVSLGFDLHLTDGYTFVFDPRPTWVAFLAGIVVAGFSGWLIGKISFTGREAQPPHQGRSALMDRLFEHRGSLSESRAYHAHAPAKAPRRAARPPTQATRSASEESDEPTWGMVSCYGAFSARSRGSRSASSGWVWPPPATKSR